MVTAVSQRGRIFLGRYEAQQLLAEGGMGQVYLGRRLKDGQAVVIKVMHGHIAVDPTFRKNFEREMQLMTRFRHPNAVALYDASLDEPPCIVMEYVPGETLDAIVQKHGRLSAEHVGRILGQLCPALYAAHGMEILHRDLTPSNIMVANADTPRERIKVMDFGLALMNETFYIPLEKLNGGSNAIGGGTPDYVPPEQVRGDAVDQRSDLYSVGVMLYKLLTGVLPFEKYHSVDDILQAHVRLTPPKFAQIGVRDVPAKVEAVVQTLLCKFPAERPADAKDLAERYGRALGQSIAPPTAFVFEAPKIATPTAYDIDLGSVLDKLEAWMPEQIAVMKLRGFVDGVGGEIIDSQPGLIRVRLPDPGAPKAQQPAGLLDWLGLSQKSERFLTWLGFPQKPPPPEPRPFFLDLHMEKQQHGTRNMLAITVSFRTEQRGMRAMRHREYAENLCRDLRAYLICS
jgi:eukaryotic-like serine/threonine-protein kinase